MIHNRGSYRLRYGRRAMVRVASFAIAAIAVMAGFMSRGGGTARNYHRMVINNYKHSFNELVSDINGLDNALRKCLYAGGDNMVIETCAEAYGKALVASQSISRLPGSDHEFEKLSGFVNQVGDYTFTLSKKVSRGGKMTDEDKKSLKSLSDVLGVMSGNFDGVLAEVNDGSMSLDELDHLAAVTAKKSDALTKGIFIERMKVAEEEFPEIPTLMYDGPFSSHINAQKPKMLEGKQDVSERQAQEAAIRFSGKQGLSFDGLRGGNLPVYTFSDDSGVIVEVSKAGGIVVNMYGSRIPGDAKVPPDKAIANAKKFLEEHGLKDMKESYRQKTGGVLTINFAHVTEGVICYTDLMKIEVALDDGEILGFEAQGYVMRHHERTIPEPKITEAAARGKISGDVKVLSHSLAIIPTPGQGEVFCHEFKCENSEGQHCIDYINAETGVEEKILLLLEDENGTLAV
jgi:germination protein YpeB